VEKDDPEYAMFLKPNFQPIEEVFKNFIGTYYNIGYLPVLIFVAPFCDNFNRKIIIGLCTMGVGITFCLISEA
jgi:hypothetical protein